MANYDPPCKTLFFVCYSTLAAIVATEAGLFRNPDTYLAELSHQQLVEEFEEYLASNKEHPWCGTGRMDGVEYLEPEGGDGIRFINNGDSDANVLNPRAI